MKEQHKPFIFKSTLLGFVAYWATSQSPYNAPDGLVEVLTEFNRRLNRKQYDCIPATREYLFPLLRSQLLTIPQVEKWNERKNGNNSPHQFVSRYDGETNPDNDFIDLDALIGNITRSCIKEDRENLEEYLESERRTFKK